MRYLKSYFLVAGVSIASLGSAIDIVVPNANTSTPGPSNQAFPFNQGDMRYQQVFAASQFGGNSGLVTGFRYRVDEVSGNPFGPAGINCQIWLSHTVKNPQGLDPVFANNIGGDNTMVFNGVMTISSAGNSSFFDIFFDINDVFTYNGTGNLLLDVKVFGAAITTQFDAAGTGFGQGGTSWTDRLWAIGVNSTSGSSDGDDGMVTQFTIVPEPASMAILGIGAAAVLARRRRR